VITIATVAELLVKIGGDNSGLKRSLKDTKQDLQEASSGFELSSKSIAILSTAATAMGAFGVAAVKSASDMESLQNGFTVLLKSADEAEKMMTNLKAFAATTPFNMEGLGTQAKQMLAMGWAAEDIIPALTIVGDTVGAIGGGDERLGLVVKALSQIKNKGKLSTEELNQLAENGVSAAAYLAKALGTDVSTALKKVEDGAVDSGTAITAIMTGMRENFAGGMDKASKTIPGIMSNIKDSAEQTMASIGKTIIDSLDLKTVLGNVSNELGTFTADVQSNGIRQALINLVPDSLQTTLELLYATFDTVGGVLSIVTGFVKEHTNAISYLVGYGLELAAAYKAVSIAGNLMSGITSVYAKLQEAAIASYSTQIGQDAALTAQQEKSMARAIAASNARYAAMETASAKATMKMGLDSEATAVKMAEDSAKIQAAAIEAAAAIQVQFTKAYATVNAESTTSATVQKANLAGVAATAEGTAVAVAGVGTAATAAGVETVGAMTVATTGVKSLATAVFTLIGGWVGVGIAAAYAAVQITKAWATREKTEAKQYEKQGLDVKYLQPQYGGNLGGYMIQSALPTVENGKVVDSSAQEEAAAQAAEEATAQAKAEEEKQKAIAETEAMMQRLANATGNLGGGAKAGTDKAAKAYEKLEDQAEKVDDSIRKEYLSLTDTKMSSLNNWYDEEKTKLDESQSANKNYTNDLAMLDEIKAAKAAKILQEQQKNTNAVWDQAYSDAKSYSDRVASLGLTGVRLEEFNIKSNAAAEIMKIKNAARDLEEAFAASTDQEDKLQKIQAWTAAGVAFTVYKNGVLVDAKELAAGVNAGTMDMKNTTISMTEETGKQVVLLNSETADKLKKLKKEETLYKEDLDKAYTSGNIAEYQKLYNEHQTMQTKALSDNQTYLDAWTDATKAASKSSMQYILDTISGVSDSVNTFISDSISGADSLSDTWKALGQNIRKVFADIVAGYISSGLKELLLTGLSPSSGTGSTGTSSNLLTTGATTVSSMTSGSTDATTSALTSVTSGLSALGTTTQGVTTALGVYNAVQAVTNATKPVESAATTASIAATASETAAVVAGTAALASFTAAAVSASAALAAVAASSAVSSATSSGSSILSSVASVIGLASGGVISGPGTSTSDSIPAMLSDGEAVLNAKATKRLGANAINVLNSGKTLHFATGGLVTGASLASVSYSRVSASRLDYATAGSSSGGSGVVVTQNNYGDYNTQTDISAVNKSLGRAIRQATRR